MSFRTKLLTGLLLTAISLFIRVEYAQHTIYKNPIVSDARQYVIYGYNIKQYGVYSYSLNTPPEPDSFRSPGYPLLISLAFKFGGTNGFYPLLIYAQGVIGALVVFFTFLLGIRYLSFGWAFLAGLLVAFNPHLISMTNYVLTETLFSFLLIVAIFCFYKALPKLHIGYLICAGFFFGLAYLTNETVLFIPVLFCFVLLLFSSRLIPDFRSRISYKLSVFFFIFFVFPAGWAIRNEVNVPKEGIKGQQRALNTLSHGAYPGFMYKNPEYRYFPYREDPLQPRFSSSIDEFLDIFWNRFKERPLRYISWYLFEKPYYLWSWNILQGQGDVYVYPVVTSLYQISPVANFSRGVVKLLHPFILLLTVIGIFLFFKNHHGYPPDSRGSIFLLLILIYYTFLYTVFAPWPRYSIPLRPELYLWAIWSLSNLLSLIRKKEYRKIKNSFGAGSF